MNRNDYHIHVSSITDAKSLILGLKDSHLELSIHSHVINIYEYPLVDYGIRNSVKIIKSMGFISNDEHEFIVFNPEKNAMNVSDKIKEEKEIRLIHIFDSLINTFELSITPSVVLDGKSTESFYTITDQEILEGIVECPLSEAETVHEAYSIYFSRINVPNILPTSEYFLSNLKNETIYFVVMHNMDITDLEFLKQRGVTGVIVNERFERDGNLIRNCQELDLDVRYGSGMSL